MKKKLVMAVVAAMTLSLVGCGSKTATEEPTVVTEEAASVEAESTVEPTQTEEESTVQDEVTLGKVTAIDGDTITVALGEMNLAGDKSGEAPSGDKPEGEAPSGDKPEGEAPSGDKPEGEAPSGDKAEGEAPSGDKPEGEAPSGENKGTPFEESGETVTITLDDTITIQLQDGGSTTEGTSDDIAEGSIISIIYDADGNVTSIEVMGQSGDAGSSATETSTEETTEETTSTEE